ncbi:hypothetical protein FisN_6Hh418 [Fistulifera solaris]|uniref:Endonuclease/exonuclease/phosphatase domain-containing protein n=1 Tax=Fistulifera solaris TaxID=1519565 RepID=A0A1Z5K6F9_FISSO|nr:hypothetical protein FisN_6Hh418 [Fistulifera solaris]|eukprot:GAX21528.1 hypothetical protein FisN_6Hh418 [Fistulifera solaris]
MNSFTPVKDQFGLPAWQDISENRFIRIESEVVSDHALTTTEQVWKQIRNVRSTQQEYGPSNLLSRTWIPSTPLTPTTENTFSVAQFNALAEGLSAGPNVPTPFTPCLDDDTPSSNNINSNKNPVEMYGGFTSIPHPELILDFELRKWRLLEVLLTSDQADDTTVKPCDLLAVEEMDRFYGFFAPMLRLFGYHGAFCPKRQSPGVSMGWYSDGCALFWNQQVFEVISQRHHGYSVGNQVALHVVLRHQSSNRLLVVVVTHLKAKCSAANEMIRMTQLQELLVQIEETIKDVPSKVHDSNQIPVILLGDFNTDPPATFPSQGASSLNQLITASNGCFQSLYPLDSSTHYTTWKARGSETVKRIIDYIFYRGPVEPVATLEVPEETELEPTKLPGLRYPSDHVLIAGRFHFL